MPYDDVAYEIVQRHEIMPEFDNSKLTSTIKEQDDVCMLQ